MEQKLLCTVLQSGHASYEHLLRSRRANLVGLKSPSDWIFVCWPSLQKQGSLCSTKLYHHTEKTPEVKFSEDKFKMCA